MKNYFTFISLFAMLVLTCTFSPIYGQWEKNIIDANLDGSCFVYIADIDGDDDLDVAATGYLANRVVWYENDGANWIKHTIDSLNTSPHGIHAADIDADGDSDLVVAEYSTHKVVWFENAGGTPINWNKHVLDPYLMNATRVMVEDIDSDGDLDVAASPWNKDRWVWYANLGGIPINWHKYTINGGGGHLRFTDMDGDSALDLVTTGKFPTEVIWFKNNLPDTNWTKYIIDPNPPGARQNRVGDIDGDSDPDVVITTNDANMVFWYENEDGLSMTWSRHTIDDFLYRSAGLDLTDIDGDSALDVVASGYDANDVVWYKNSFPDTSWTKYYIDANLNGAGNLKTIDFDSDGDPDVFVVGQNDDNVAWYRNDVWVPSGIEPLSNNVLKSYTLKQNYPNPFNPITNIEFSIPRTEFVTLKIFNLLGQNLVTLVSERLKSGRYQYTWDAGSLASGVYLYHLQAENYTETKKMILIR